jgi:hypothetical protein
MALATLGEVRAAVGSTQSDSVLMDRLAGVSAAIERYCNRAFPKRVSAVAVASGVLSLTIPRHGFMAGDVVVVKSSTANSSLDGTKTIASVVSEHVFTITTTLTEDEIEGLEITVRKRRESIRPTRGGRSMFLDPLPVSEVVSLSLSDGAQGWTLLETTEYDLAEKTDGLSTSGEVILYTKAFPSYRDGRIYPSGMKAVFVSGAAWVQPDIVQACLAVCKTIDKRQRSAGLSSESYDYYSYTRMTSTELKQLFGEVESTLTHYRITAV